MADKPKKPQKLRARLPRGLADRGPAEIAATRAMVEKIREVYERYGFEPVETPAFEYTDALGKFLPDQDRPNEGVFSLQDDDEQWISLRYDLTAPLARYVAENFDALPKPYRSYRFGWVFRNEKPGPGRFRQFMQFDADTVGAPTAAADAEMCMMAADTMEALGIPRGSYVVRLSDRRIWDGVLEVIGLSADRKLIVLRAIDKLDRLGLEGVEELLGVGRRDESGDFTRGAGLNSDQVLSIMTLIHGSELDEMVYSKKTEFDGGGEKLLSTMHFSQDSAFMNNLRALGQKFAINESFSIGFSNLETIEQLVRSSGYGADRIRISGTVVRGLEYYTGPVYEVELLLDTKDEKGRPVRFGSVGGGGRYDGLVSRFRGEPVPATGFSIGVSRLQAALTLIGQLNNKPQPGPVVVTVFGGDIAGYQKMVATLRSAGIRAELYLGNPKHSLGQQMKYADKRNSPCAIIQGSDEKAQGIVQIKDLILGAELASLEKDRDEYLKKQAEAQFSCGEDELVAKVQDLLQRRGVSWT
ncbi:histidine--tRNA ligase [Rhodopseudomonas palustris]|uniref:histidine--tRNA ligase n=1 Tax=Rhodopseudomonas palustris TaxID=1076 RepID=UPI003CC81996